MVTFEMGIGLQGLSLLPNACLQGTPPQGGEIEGVEMLEKKSASVRWDGVWDMFGRRAGAGDATGEEDLVNVV